MGPPAGGLVRGRNVAGWESRGEEEPGQHPRVDCTHVSHVSPLSTLCLGWCSLGWAAAGWRLAESLPSSHTTAAAGPSAAQHTNTNTHQTFRENTQTILDICTLKFTYRFAMTYSHISIAMLGPCLRCSKVSVLGCCACADLGCAGRRLRLRAEICQCPRRQNWIVSSQHRGATCLATSRAGLTLCSS